MEQKTILITGASRGIGKSIALRFASRGYHTFLNCSSSVDELKKLRAYIRKKYHTPCTIVVGDVGNPDHVRAIYNRIYHDCSHLDVLVNNAGITKDNLLMKMSEEEFDAVIDTNLKGAFNCIKHVSRQMLKQKGGRIINISSVSGVMGNAGQANYCASKAGVIGLTKSVAREIGSRGITVNAIAPGFIDTEMTAVLPDDVKKAMGEQIPLKRFGTTEDVAQAAVFLASDRAAYITGQVLCVDGGMAM